MMNTQASKTFLPIVAAAAWALSAVPAGARDSTTEPLSLEDCLRIAVENHPTLDGARAAIEAAEAGVTEAAASWWPQVDLNAGYHRWQRRIFLPDDLLPSGMPTPEIVGPLNDWNASVMARVTVFDFGERRSVNDAAEALREAARADARATRMDLELAVRQAFYTLAAAEEFQAAAERSVARAEANAKLAQSRYQAGAVARVDVLRAQADAANARLGLIAARSRVSAASGRLNAAMGRPASDPVRIAKAELPEAGVSDAASAGERALAQRPELQSMREKVRASEAALSGSKASRAPRVLVDGSFGWRDTDFLPETQEWSAGVAVVWPVFDGGSRRGRIERAGADLARARSTLEAAELRVREEVWSAGAELERAREALAASEALVGEREESVRVIRARYEAGSALVVDLLATEAALAEAEAGLARARWELRVAEAVFDRAVGEGSVE